MTRGATVIAAIPRLRQRRRAGRRLTVRRLLSAGIVAVLLGGVGWAVFESSLFGVREITVEGTSRLSVAQVLTAAQVKSGEPLMQVDPATVAHRVEALPVVASARVSRDWPHRIVIDVVERRAVAVVDTGKGPTLLDATGVAFLSVATAPRGLVPVTVGAPVPGAGDADARAAMQVLAALPTRVRRLVETVRAPSPYDVSIDLRDGRVVVWGSADDGAAKAIALRALLRKHAHVYDVSAPGIAVIR